MQYRHTSTHAMKISQLRPGHTQVNTQKELFVLNPGRANTILHTHTDTHKRNKMQPFYIRMLVHMCT